MRTLLLAFIVLAVIGLLMSCGARNVNMGTSAQMEIPEMRCVDGVKYFVRSNSFGEWHILTAKINKDNLSPERC